MEQTPPSSRFTLAFLVLGEGRGRPVVIGASDPDDPLRLVWFRVGASPFLTEVALQQSIDKPGMNVFAVLAEIFRPAFKPDPCLGRVAVSLKTPSRDPDGLP